MTIQATRLQLLRSDVDQQQAASLADEAGAISERELVAAARTGDRGAAEKLVELTYEKVFAAVRRLCGNAEVASDITQEAYRRAWASLGSFEGRSRFSTWLFRIAYNGFLNQNRRPALMTALGDEIDVADPSVGAAERLTEKEERERLRRMVLELPDELRLVVAARYWGEISAHEIARAEGVSRSAIRKRLARARRILHGRLGGRR